MIEISFYYRDSDPLFGVYDETEIELVIGEKGRDVWRQYAGGENSEDFKRRLPF